MKEIKTIGVVGAGAMGRGITQLFVQSGFTVCCYDTSSEAVSEAIENVQTMIERSVTKGRLPSKALSFLTENLIAASSLNDLADCDLVIEAIIEDVEVKQRLFAELESIISKNSILASNTSSLVIAEIAGKCVNPERVAGLHFFNPVPLMKVVEVIAAVRTDSEVVKALQTAVAGTGHRAVVTEDQPGFLVNHAGRGLYTEGLRIVEERIASPEQVDTVLREAIGFKMGPFELMDLTGLDVSGKVMQSIYDQFLHEPRFRPSSLIAPRVAAGLYGRKTGQGWYQYVDGNKLVNKDVSTQNNFELGTVWVDNLAQDAKTIRNLVEQSGNRLASSPSAAELIVIQPWGLDATTYACERNFDTSKIIGVDPLPGLDKHLTLMLSVNTHPHALNIARGLFNACEVPFTVINDSPGFICQRVLATVVNIAANIAQRSIASVDDIEAAVKIGLGYPMGPLSLGDVIGVNKIYEILQNQQEITGDDRYRASLWLRRRAQLGLSLTATEAQCS